jgi:hypothetical protein
MSSVFLPNVQSEPRSWLARVVLLGARNVTAMIVGSTAWFGGMVFILGEELRALEKTNSDFGFRLFIGGAVQYKDRIFLGNQWRFVASDRIFLGSE